MYKALFYAILVLTSSLLTWQITLSVIVLIEVFGSPKKVMDRIQYSYRVVAGCIIVLFLIVIITIATSCSSKISGHSGTDFNKYNHDPVPQSALGQGK